VHTGRVPHSPVAGMLVISVLDTTSTYLGKGWLSQPARILVLPAGNNDRTTN